jgi:hypothetical protein
MTTIPKTQAAIQFTAPETITLNREKPVTQPEDLGPHQILLKIDACGI